MSDTALNKIIQYGTAADRALFTPNPAVGSKVLYLWQDSDAQPNLWFWNGAAWVQIADVFGPASAVNNDIAVFDGVTGKLIKDGGTTIAAILAAIAAAGINQLTGDVTAGPGTGSQAATIPNNTVTFAKMQDISTDKLIGRDTAASGDPEQIGVAKGIEFDGAQNIQETVNSRTRVFGIVIDGGGSAITTGLKYYKSFPVAGTIKSWRILLDQSGSIVIDIWKDTYANYPPTVADTITAAAKPTVTTATKNESSTLTGWTTSIAAGDVFGFNVDSITTATWAILEVTVEIAG